MTETSSVGAQVAGLDLSGLAGTFLGDLDGTARLALLDRAVARSIPAGRVIFSRDGAPRMGVVLEGLARTQLRAADGGAVTIRFVSVGSLVSATSGLGGDQVPVVAAAVSDVTILEFETAVLMDLVRTNASAGAVLMAELTRRLEEVYRTLAGVAFGSLTERVAGYILDVARAQPAAGLVVGLTQQELADGLGTARETVSRSLQQLRRDGIVRTERGGIVIRDSRALARRAGAWWTTSRLVVVDPSAGPTAIFDLAPHAVIGIDPDGEVIYANAAAERTFGWSRASLLGGDVARLLPPGVGEGFRAALPSFVDGSVRGAIGLGQLLHGRRKDGSLFPAEIQLAPIASGARVAVFATVIDVSYRSAIRAALDQRSADGEVLVS